MLVDRYPTILFIGSGNFHQSHPLGSNIIRFEADIIPNALYDWIRFLSFNSRLHRGWNHLKEFTSVLFSGDEKSMSPNKSFRKQLMALETEVLSLRSQLERYEVLELFDQLPNLGDAFAHLEQVMNKTVSNQSVLTSIFPFATHDPCRPIFYLLWIASPNMPWNIASTRLFLLLLFIERIDTQERRNFVPLLQNVL